MPIEYCASDIFLGGHIGIAKSILSHMKEIAIDIS